jgi:hypothetical protein
MDQDSKTDRSVFPVGAELNEPPSANMRDLVPVSAHAYLPVPLPTSKKMSARMRWIRVALVLAVVVGGAGAYFWVW